ncbi:MAG: hypothetical protein ABEH60_04325 [Halonotius sp.]
MSQTDEVGGDADPCPIKLAFGESGIPDDCQISSYKVMCSLLDHHASLIPTKRGIKIAKQCDHDALKASGMITPKNVVQPVYQLKSEFGNRVKAGFFAEVVTPEHEAYPLTVFHGFRMITVHDEFEFAGSVQDKIEQHFNTAEMVATEKDALTVLTATDPFPHQFVDSLRS